ncbi:MAG TPA: DUF1592 domain-containing protein [Polyangiaceae bacterium]|nr:DUF1592 domain-containing protein [Polyangiaceae bacterium]
MKRPYHFTAGLRLARAGVVALAVSLPLACSSTPAKNAGPTLNGGGGASSSGGSGNTGGVVVTGPSGQQCVQGASLAPARLFLVSDVQYRNIVNDVFGVDYPANVDVTAPASTSGIYPYNEGAQVQATTIKAYLRAADQVAALIPAFAPCAAGAANAMCMEQFLRTKLPVAWRRPVTDQEIGDLIAIFNSGAPDGQAVQVRLTMEAALTHSAFLYRAEFGGGASPPIGKVPLTPHQLAAAVSFGLLNSTPDAELWAKAVDGSLTQPQVLAAQVARLLALAPVRTNLQKKVSFLFNFEKLPFIHKDAAEFPEFGTLQSALYQSSQKFLADILGQGRFSDLFTSRTIYANEPIAKAYGLPPVTGMDLQKVTTTGAAYDGGVLTQPALLASSTLNAAGDDVVHRGLWVYYNLLCAPDLPPPPPGALAAAATMTGSTREVAMQRGNGCGKACHGRFDAFGLVTLGYDGIGRYRTTDPTSTPPGGPLDTTATIAGGVLEGHAETTTLTGVAQLAQMFGAGRQVSDCAASNLAAYVLEHQLGNVNSCDLQAVEDRFEQTGSFTDLFAGIITSPAFLTRDAE